MGGSGGHRRLPGGSDDFSWHTDRQTHTHNICIIIIIITRLVCYTSLNGKRVTKTQRTSWTSWPYRIDESVHIWLGGGSCHSFGFGSFDKLMIKQFFFSKDNLMTFGDTIWNVQTWFSKAGPDESGDQNLIAGRSCCQFFLEQRPNSSLLSISFLCLSSVWSFWVVVWVHWAWTDVSFRNRYHCITPFGFETEVNLIDHLGTRQA